MSKVLRRKAKIYVYYTNTFLKNGILYLYYTYNIPFLLYGVIRKNIFISSNNLLHN